MTIGERIKARRKALGMSADDLAVALGKNRATIYRYESNYIEKMPTTVLEPLAKALHTTPAFLMGWDESENAPAASEPVVPRCPMACTPREKDLIRKYRCLPPPVQNAVDTMIEGQYALACPRVKNEEEIS